MSTAGSQEGQDRWIIDTVCAGKNGGWFVEVGAGDGRYLSNTWLLEKACGWQGLCIEPSRTFALLCRERWCRCDNSVLAPRSGPVDFLESAGSELGADPYHHLSGIVGLLDHWHPVGEVRQRYARSPADVLAYWEMPAKIDYLSLDVEGAEMPLLAAWPFAACRPTAITVEHNGSEAKRAGFLQLLAPHGYRRDRTTKFDDWFLSVREA